MNARTRDKYQKLVSTVKALPATPTAVAHPCDEASLSGAIDAAKMKIIVPILVGPRHKILTAAKAANLDVAPYEIVDAEHSHDAADKAVALVREGRAEMLMKGSLSALPRAITDRGVRRYGFSWSGNHLDVGRPAVARCRTGARWSF